MLRPAQHERYFLMRVSPVRPKPFDTLRRALFEGYFLVKLISQGNKRKLFLLIILLALRHRLWIAKNAKALDDVMNPGKDGETSGGINQIAP